MSVVAPSRTRSRWLAVKGALTPAEWARAGGMVGFIVMLHVVGFALLIAGAAGHYHLDAKTTFGIGTGTLAYTLGMRHAFDADHISAIDNTTRKLMAEGKRPLSVGFFFSLGHSSVVFVLSILLNFGIRALNSGVKNGNSGLHHYTGLIGTAGVGGLPLHHRPAQHRDPGVDRAHVRRHAAGSLRPRGDGAAAQRPGDDEPLPRAARPADRHPMEDVPDRVPLRVWASTPPPRSLCWCWPARRWSAACPFWASCPCRSFSPPGCRCSTPPTACS